MPFTIRTAQLADHDAIISVADRWWGRSVVVPLPRLFLNHFYNTSFAAKDDSGLAGFLISFLSSSETNQA